MARGIWILVLSGAALLAQAQQQQEPPEEDATLIEKKEYTFNPLQAESEIKIGKFYMKKASYKAAIQRFTEATKWNPNSPEAWLALGDAYEKAKDTKNAKLAYAKYIELAPDAKNVPAIKKKLERPATSEPPPGNASAKRPVPPPPVQSGRGFPPSMPAPPITPR